MVRIIWNCDCDTCNGGDSVPSGSFGGSKCMCGCHSLKGKKRDEFIKLKKEANRG